MLVHELLEHSADRLPNKVALVCDGQRLTYAEVDAQVNRLANALTAQGLQRGDRVVLYLPNCLELAIAIFAVSNNPLHADKFNCSPRLSIWEQISCTCCRLKELSGCLNSCNISRSCAKTSL